LIRIDLLANDSARTLELKGVLCDWRSSHLLGCALILICMAVVIAYMRTLVCGERAIAGDYQMRVMIIMGRVEARGMVVLGEEGLTSFQDRDIASLLVEGQGTQEDWHVICKVWVVCEGGFVECNLLGSTRLDKELTIDIAQGPSTVDKSVDARLTPNLYLGITHCPATA
jgi:hypothetical protein